MEVNRAGINETGVLTALLFQQQPVPALVMIHVWALGGQELSVWVKSSFLLSVTNLPENSSILHENKLTKSSPKKEII